MFEKRLPRREHSICSFPGAIGEVRSLEAAGTTLSSSAVALPSPVLTPPEPERENAGPGPDGVGAEAERARLVCNLPGLEPLPKSSPESCLDLTILYFTFQFWFSVVHFSFPGVPLTSVF